MKPARTGIINANADPPPIVISAAASVPSSLNASIPNTKERAMIKPPATNVAAYVDTPVIRCLYTPFFSSLCLPEEG